MRNWLNVKQKNVKQKNVKQKKCEAKITLFLVAKLTEILLLPAILGRQC